MNLDDMDPALRDYVATARDLLGPSLLAELGESPDAIHGARLALALVLQSLSVTLDVARDEGLLTSDLERGLTIAGAAALGALAALDDVYP